MNHHGKRRRNSARQNKEHSVQRAEERYDIDLSNRKRKRIARMIESGEARFLRNGGMAQRKVYTIYFEEKHLWIVYDHYTRRIVTFLSNEQRSN